MSVDDHEHSGAFKKNAFSATLWSGVNAVTMQATTFIFSLFLARLLSPREFGLMAIVAIFTSFASMFVDCGFGAALIQKKDLDAEDASSVYYFNLAAAVLVAVLLALAAPFVSDFFKYPELRWMLVVMAFNLVLASFGTVPAALITRRMDFRSQTVVGLAAGLVSGTVGVTLAWRGLGVWSLVAQALVSTALTVAGLRWMVRWKPRMQIKVAALKRMFAFSSGMMGSNVLNTVFESAYPAVIGKLFSVADLGLFSRASGLRQIPMSLMETTVGRVMFPMLSRVNSQPERVAKVSRQVLIVTMLVSVPLMLGLSCLAEPVIRFLYGEKWLAAAPFLAVLCLGQTLWPMHVVNLAVLKAMGRSDLFFRLEVIKRVLLVVVLLSTFRFGILAMCWGQVCSGVAAFGINAFYTGRLVGYSWKRQLADIASIAGCGGLMVLALLGVLRWAPDNAGLKLLVAIPAGSAVYFAAGWMSGAKAFQMAFEHGRDIVVYVVARRGAAV